MKKSKRNNENSSDTAKLEHIYTGFCEWGQDLGEVMDNMHETLKTVEIEFDGEATINIGDYLNLYQSLWMKSKEHDSLLTETWALLDSMKKKRDPIIEEMIKNKQPK